MQRRPHHRPEYVHSFCCSRQTARSAAKGFVKGQKYTFLSPHFNRTYITFLVRPDRKAFINAIMATACWTIPDCSFGPVVEIMYACQRHRCMHLEFFTWPSFQTSFIGRNRHHIAKCPLPSPTSEESFFAHVINGPQVSSAVLPKVDFFYEHIQKY